MTSAQVQKIIGEVGKEHIHSFRLGNGREFIIRESLNAKEPAEFKLEGDLIKIIDIATATPFGYQTKVDS